jgi:hypothetical protein
MELVKRVKRVNFEQCAGCISRSEMRTEVYLKIAKEHTASEN